ncbi:unnamed protein product [Phytophthora lilii]|uniref:Unnamed protein product n=1 Tax=Phytophthora lilii TaxID=2077276 RepID=A0A9W7D867_9STRA|nr:unnamed protein product [Phytophthora lilii]
MDFHQDIAAPRLREKKTLLDDAHSSASRRSGFVPVTTAAPNENTKLLNEEDAKLEKETKKYFHTKHLGLAALLGKQELLIPVSFDCFYPLYFAT